MWQKLERIDHEWQTTADRAVLGQVHTAYSEHQVGSLQQWFETKRILLKICVNTMKNISVFAVHDGVFLLQYIKNYS